MQCKVQQQHMSFFCLSTPNGGGAGNRTRVQNKSIIKSFTSLVGLFPNQQGISKTRAPLSRIRASPAKTGLPLWTFFYSVRSITYPIFVNKVIRNPAIKQLRRNRTQHCRWHLKFATLSIHVSQLDTCTHNL